MNFREALPARPCEAVLLCFVTAIAEIVSDSAGTWKNRLASDATISRTSPTMRNLRMNEKSFFVTVAMAAIAKKIAAVIAPASPTS